MKLVGQELGSNQKGLLAIDGPLPPGCYANCYGEMMSVSSKPIGKAIPGKMLYSTFDWGIKDDDGYYFILGRTDDVINTAGHRLGTREIEESIASHS
jgi:propionyl-CoA synthetase